MALVSFFRRGRSPVHPATDRRANTHNCGDGTLAPRSSKCLLSRSLLSIANIASYHSKQHNAYMTALPASVATTIPVSSLEHPLKISGELILRVLGNAGEHLVSGRTVKLIGRRLIAQVWESLEPETCIRIDCVDAFVLGETLGCWREGGATFVAVELHQALTGLERLAKLEGESWEQPRRLEVQMRRSA